MLILLNVLISFPKILLESLIRVYAFEFLFWQPKVYLVLVYELKIASFSSSELPRFRASSTSRVLRFRVQSASFLSQLGCFAFELLRLFRFRVQIGFVFEPVGCFVLDQLGCFSFELGRVFRFRVQVASFSSWGALCFRLNGLRVLRLSNPTIRNTLGKIYRRRITKRKWHRLTAFGFVLSSI